MVTIVAGAKTPPSPIQDSRIAFATHFRYLHAIHELMGSDAHPVLLETLAKSVSQANAFQTVTLGTSNYAPIESALTMAWATEAALNMPLPEPLIAVSNNWATVQAYYSCYQALGALCLAVGKPVTRHAAGSQRYQEFWVQPGWHISPWTVSYGAKGFQNCPVLIGTTIPKTSQLGIVSTSNAWGHVERCLRSTREDWIEEARKQKRKTKAKAVGRTRTHLNTAELRAIKVSMKPATVLDYMYRLRRRSNYEDASMFVEGPIGVSQSALFNQRLRELTSATLMLHEVVVGRLVGEARLRSWADKWMKSIPLEGHTLGLHIRRQCL